VPGTILVGYDDSQQSHRALDRAVREARGRDEHITVLAVYEMPLDPRAPRAFGTEGDGVPIKGPFEPPPHIQAVLDAAGARLEGTGITVAYAWAPGPPGKLIVDVAAERGADLIVLGPHHHVFLGALFGADVTREVRARAGCEVVVVD
jgi:nucleotide-binding universal stress UspA family protein